MATNGNPQSYLRVPSVKGYLYIPNRLSAYLKSSFNNNPSFIIGDLYQEQSRAIDRLTLSGLLGFGNYCPWLPMA
jgi:hypothetical protein